VAVKVAVIGTGWADRVQIPAFQAAGLEVVGLAGRDPEKTARVARAHGVPFWTGDWRELLETDAGLISVTSPPKLHKEQALAALGAGKGLLCEKPLALNEGEAQTMCDAADRHPEQFALVDHELRFTPARRKARELLRAGAIGRPLAVTARVATDMRADPDKPWTWWSDASQGGGILGAIGSHVFDGLRWLLEELTGCVEVRGAAFGTAYKTRRDEGGNELEVTADDVASVVFHMGETVGTALIHGVALDESVDLLTVRGDEGTLVVDRSLKLYLGKRGGPLKEYVTQLPGLIPNRFRSSPFAAGTVLLGQALADAFESGDRAPLAHAASLHDGLEVQRILDAARRMGNVPSASTG